MDAVKAGFFDSLLVPADPETDFSDPTVANAIAAFAALAPERRLAEPRRVAAYYRDVRKDDAEFVDDLMAEPLSDHDIWKNVAPGHLFIISRDSTGGHCDLAMEAECA